MKRIPAGTEIYAVGITEHTINNQRYRSSNGGVVLFLSEADCDKFLEYDNKIQKDRGWHLTYKKIGRMKSPQEYCFCLFELAGVYRYFT